MSGEVSVREIQSLSEMQALAHELAGSLGRRQLILLDGPMGAGKTQFTKFLLEALGGSEVVSPSFAIHNSYASRRGFIEHMDLFRLESEEDLESTGFWDFFRAREGVVIVEWAERLNEMGLTPQLPRTWPCLALRFEVPTGSGEKRRVSIRS